MRFPIYRAAASQPPRKPSTPKVLHRQALARKSRYFALPMAEESGVTEAGLKATLTEKLQATHVEIEDMSGTSFLPCAPPAHVCPFPLPLPFPSNHAPNPYKTGPRQTN